MTRLTDMLLKLCAQHGPTGYEDDAARLAQELLSPYMDEVYTDAMHNVIGVRRCGNEGAKTLLLDAHIDEIGFVITGIEEGFLRCAPLGGADERNLPASEVMVLSDPPRYGVFCALAPHVTAGEDKGKAVKLEDMYIDIGLTQDEAEKSVPLGTPAVFARGAVWTGGDIVFGRALDNRAGFVSIVRALELLSDEKLDVDMYVMASVQEELGVRGAKPGAYGIDPDFCVVVDVDFAKTPDSASHEIRQTLGGGVIVSLGPNMNRRLSDFAVKLCKDNDIKYSIGIEPGGNSGTNAAAIQISRSGVATALFGMPVRYMHSQNAAVSLADIESTAQLIYQTAKHIGEVR